MAKTALPFDPPIRKPRCYIHCRPAWSSPESPDVEVEAKLFATLHRAVLPGHPTDVFVVKVVIPDPKKYPEGVAAIQGREIHLTSDFETAMNLLGALGLGMCRDEDERGEGKVLPATVTPDGQPAPTRVTKVRFREGFYETSMEFADAQRKEGEEHTSKDEQHSCGENLERSNSEGHNCSGTPAPAERSTEDNFTFSPGPVADIE